MKMYICVKEDIPAGIAINSAAHGSLMAFLKFSDKPDMKTWLDKSFKKVTCAVTPAEFAMLKEVSDNLVVTESRLEGKEVAVVLCPRQETDYPEFVSLLKLWK
jgi:peptidyl-tRNA hydrolase